MRIQRRYITILFWSLILLSGCVPETSPVTSPDPTTFIPKLESNLEPDIFFRGKVVLRQTYSLSFPISGIVKEMLVKEGQYLETGELIASLDTTDLENEITRAEDKFIIAQAYLERALLGANREEIIEAEYRLETTRTYQALRSVQPTQQAFGSVKATQQALDSVQATQQVIDIIRAEEHLAYLLSLPLPENTTLAWAELEQASNNLDIAKSQLQLAKLTAPMDGMVLDIFVQENEYIAQGMPIIEISDSNDLLINIEFEDIDFSSINIGDKADVYIEALPDLAVIAEVVNIRSNLDDGGFIAELEFAEPPPELLWGMSVEAKFQD